MSAPPSRALFAARCLVGELARAGLREACLAPGSRSTPLALALAESAAIRTRVFTDERSLAFFALGVAKAASAPVAIVCTSGTAAANLLPAVVEASLGAAALLVLTADRPPELRDCSAPQTIDQVGIYGSHVRWAFDVPILDIGEPAERYYRALAMRALAAACAHNSGPVHLNLPFREPFWDDSFTGDPRAAVTRAAAAATDQRPADAAGRSSAGASAETPAQAAQGFAGVSCSPSRLDEREARALAERIAGAQRGLIVCAGQPLPAGDIAALAAALDWPILADPLSGLRYGGHDRSLVVDAYDVLLRDETFCSGHRPDVIVRFGSTPAPRSLQMFLTQSWPCDHLLVAPSGWPDPFHACSGIVRSEPGRLCRDLTATLARTATRSDWTACWLRASRAARSALDASLDAVVESAGEAFEGAVVRAVARVTADAGGERPALFVGNSMPIRDVDAFFGQSERPLSVLANRGASGIDGVLSTALGVAATREQPTVLVLGDLSFLHDVTALAVAARLRIPLVTVVINNNGGGIFSFLAQQGLEAVFEPLFATPHDVDLAATAAALLPGGYELAADTVQLAQLLRAAIERREPRVIEIRSNRATTPQRSRRLIAQAQQAARKVAANAAAPVVAANAAAPVVAANAAEPVVAANAAAPVVAANAAEPVVAATTAEPGAGR